MPLLLAPSAVSRRQPVALAAGIALLIGTVPSAAQVAPATRGQAPPGPAAQGQIVDQISGMVGQNGAEAVQGMLAASSDTDSGLVAGLISVGVLLVGAIFSAWMTDRIGIHFIFGAFVFGVCVPRAETAQLFHDILERLEQFSLTLLLPIYFIVTGLSVDVSKFQGRTLVELLAILGVAIGGKFIGARTAARTSAPSPSRNATPSASAATTVAAAKFIPGDPIARATASVAGASYSAIGPPTCSTRPSLITTIRLASVIASSWSWVT